MEYPAANFSAMSGKLLTSVQFLGRMYSNGASGSQFASITDPTQTNIPYPEEAVTTTTPGPIMSFSVHSYTGMTNAQRLALSDGLVLNGYYPVFQIRNADAGVGHNFQLDDDVPPPPSPSGGFRSRDWRGRGR